MAGSVFLIPDDTQKIPAPPTGFFFDTNIWLFLYPTVSSETSGPRVETYSSLLKKILRESWKIHIDLLVVSEYVNRYISDEYQIHRASPDQKRKEFRSTEEYRTAATSVSDELHHILKTCERAERRFADIDCDKVASEFAAGAIDFNDALFHQLCIERQFWLVTDDGDCAFSDITVITANKKLALKLRR